jgi:hypothetical protein
VALTEFTKLNEKNDRRLQFKNAKKVKESMLKIKKLGVIFKSHVDSRIYYTFILFLIFFFIMRDTCRHFIRTDVIPVREIIIP